MNSHDRNSDKSIESKISSVIMKFHREVYGRGPLNYKVYIMDDIIVFKYKGILSESEKQVAVNRDCAEMIKNIRRRAFEVNQNKLKLELGNILNTKILNVFTDILPFDDEKVTVFTLKEKINNSQIS